jgi:translation initiation factor 2-alpha kinase 4
MHRDLNPNNIFLTESEIIKIGDFGSSRQTAVYCSDEADNDEVRRKSLTTYIGTTIYCAPELKNGKYDKRIDLYSLGIIIFEMFHFPPKTADHEKEPIFRGIRSQEVIMPEESLEPEIQDVVKGLLKHNPEYRMSLDVAADRVKQLNQFSTIKPTLATEEYGMIYVYYFKCLYII